MGLSTQASGNANTEIGPGDQLVISVFDTPELTQSVRVAEDGNAELMLIGKVRLAGLTTAAAEKVIEQELHDRKLIREPSVLVNIGEFASQHVSVLGEVARPGTYPVLGVQRLLDVLATAGGTTVTASSVLAIKHRDGREETVFLDTANDAKASFAANVRILPGDTVLVARAGVFYVLGQVSHPGGFAINSSHVTVMQALALASGTSSVANTKHARLVRVAPNGVRMEFPVEIDRILAGYAPDQTLQNNDILYVPRSRGKSVAATTLDTILRIASGASVAAIYVADH
jgi:polysaccharide export outer membrane protein